MTTPASGLTQQQQIALLQQAGMPVTTTKPKGYYVELAPGIYLPNEAGSALGDGTHGYGDSAYQLAAAILSPYENAQSVATQAQQFGLNLTGTPLAGYIGGTPTPTGPAPTSTTTGSHPGTSPPTPSPPTTGTAPVVADGPGNGVLGQQVAPGGTNQTPWPQPTGINGLPTDPTGGGGSATYVPGSGGTGTIYLPGRPNRTHFGVFQGGSPPASTAGGTGTGSTGTGAGGSGAGAGSTGSGDASGQQNAYAQLQGLLNQWGLGDLSGVVLKYIQQGYDASSIQYLLTQTPEYKKRFAANDARVKAGLGALSPAEYLATERSYQDVLRSSGLPAGFYDSPDDFTSWLAADVSPAELQNRTSEAVKFAQATDPTYRSALASYFGIDTSHIAAYFLDPTRAAPLLQKQANATEIGAAALHQGLSLTNLQDAFRYTDQGVTEQQAQGAYSTIADILPTEGGIAARFGQTYTQGDAEQEMLGGLASAQRKRTQLNQQEQALFAGSGGAGSDFYHEGYGLSRDTTASY